MNYSIGHFAQLTNISASALRYYEQEQLLVVNRDAAGRRYYTDNDIEWILFIKRLKDTGMPIHNIKEYALLRYQGDTTMPQRLKILETHKRFVVKEKEKWENNLENLNNKIAFYKRRLSE